MFKFGLITMLLFITACGTETLRCEQPMPNARVFNTTGKVHVIAEYQNQALTSYINLYQLDVSSFSNEKKAEIFQSLQDFFEESSDVIDYEQNFYQRRNHVTYEKVYDVNRFEITDDLDTIEKLQNWLEQEGYQCR